MKPRFILRLPATFGQRLFLLLATVCACFQPAFGRDGLESVNGLQGVPSSPRSGGGAGGSSPHRPSILPPHKGPYPQTGPHFLIDGFYIVDGNDNSINVTPGVPFWVEIDWEYDSPTCTDYTLSRVVNGWTNTTPAINWGCGYSGSTYWYQYWGPWLLYKAGTYPVQITVDSSGSIPQSDGDNTLLTNIVVGGTILPQWALVDVEFGRTNLGPGTDVIVGTMDDAFDFLHPWFTGNDSKGRPRLIAAVQNSLGVSGSPTNAQHSTGVLGIVLARGANNGDITGLAPDARYISAEFFNREDVPGLPELNILDAANVLLTNGAEVINLPWSYWIGPNTASESGEAPISDLMADYFAYASNIVCVAYVNELTDPIIPTAPGAARNVITVGGLDDNLVEAWIYDNYGPTIDGRCKPDVLGNSATNTIAPFWDWRDGFPASTGFWGNSFAGPFVTGAAVEMLDYAKHHAQNHDHRVIKAVIMNSGVTALDDDGAAWTNSSVVPLDNQQGTGILNLQRVYAMYSAGQQPGGAVPVPGYDFNTAYGTNALGVHTFGSTNGVVSYRLGTPAAAGADLDVTLAWDRHTFWQDENHNGIIDAADTFYVNTNTDAQSDLALVLYHDDAIFAQSASVVDTVQHLHLTNLPTGAYELEVQRISVPNSGGSEAYGLAWYSGVSWNSLPPTTSFTGATLGPGHTVDFSFNLVTGQAGNFILQSTPNLVSPTWTPVTGASLTQTGPDTFEIQVPINSGSPSFFRMNAVP